MSMSKRLYLVAGLVALVAIAFSAVTLTSRLTSAQGGDSTPVAQACEEQDEADDAAEAALEGADTDAVEEECGPQDEADDAGADVVVPCSDPTGADDDAEEANGAPDTDNIEEQCGPQDAED